MAVFVKGPGNVLHNDKFYGPGDAIEGLSKAEEKALLQAGSVQTQPIEDGVAPNLVPTSEEVEQTLAQIEDNPNPSSEDLEVK